MKSPLPLLLWRWVSIFVGVMSYIVFDFAGHHPEMVVSGDEECTQEVLVLHWVILLDFLRASSTYKHSIALMHGMKLLHMLLGVTQTI